MHEPREVDRLDRALRALGRELAYPEVPSLAPAVTSRLLADRAARSRPRLLEPALWGRRRVLAFVAIALIALLTVAAAARFVIGAAEIRVQPPAPQTSVPPPLRPKGLGDPLPLRDLEGAVGFDVRLPGGPAPDAAYVFQGPTGTAGALTAWEAGDRYAALPGTPWGLLPMQVEEDDRVVLKTSERSRNSGSCGWTGAARSGSRSRTPSTSRPWTGTSGSGSGATC